MNAFAKAVTAVTLSLCTLVFPGCASDPKAATAENFSRILAKRFQNGQNSLVCVDEQYVLFSDASGKDRLAVIGIDTSNNEALVAAGLLKKTGPQIYNGPNTTFLYKNKNKEAYAYTPLPASEAAAKGVSYAKGVTDVVGAIKLCPGHVQFDKVTNFTAPADFFGMRVSTVVFRVSFSDLQPWAKDRRMLAAFPNLKAAIEDADKDHSIMMTLTENGWQSG